MAKSQPPSVALRASELHAKSLRTQLAAVERNGDDSRPRQAQSTDERLEVIEQLLRKVAICVLFDNRTIWRIRGTTRPIPRHIA